MKQKAILAFSGGLDTSVVVKYLQEKHNMDVITVTVDVGQEDDYKKISAKAKKLGVKTEHFINRILGAGSIVLNKCMSEINSKASSVTGRVNNNMIILKVI